MLHKSKYFPVFLYKITITIDFQSILILIKFEYLFLYSLNNRKNYELQRYFGMYIRIGKKLIIKK